MENRLIIDYEDYNCVNFSADYIERVSISSDFKTFRYKCVKPVKSEVNSTENRQRSVTTDLIMVF